ncbi:MAG: tetratricopeptide repeat protein, partial [Pseudomonadota bacterium]
MQARSDRAPPEHNERLPRRSLCAFALTALLVACGAPTSAPTLDEAIAQAQALSEAGDLVGAAFVLRNAMGEHGNALALLTALAENQLAQGRPDLALSTLRRAEQTGAALEDLAPLRARAYFDAGDSRAL